MLARRCMASAPTDMPPYNSAVGITASGFSRARRATMIPTKPTPPLIPSITRCCEPRTSTIPARPPSPPAKNAASRMRRQTSMPAYRAAEGLKAGHNEFVSERHFFEQHPDRTAAASAMKMPACARVPGRIKGSHVARGSSGVSGRLPGALHRSGDEILQDKNRDVIRHQGNENFVSAERARTNADEARPNAAATKPNENRQRQKKKKRKRTDARARSRQQERATRSLRRRRRNTLQIRDS